VRDAQLPLLFARGSDTSAAAALSVDGPKLRELVLFTIRASGHRGMTCDEIEQILDMRHQTISARVNELRNGGWIVDSGIRRPTRSNRNAVVWVVQ
jgi:transposase